MEANSGDLVGVISGALSRRHAVEAIAVSNMTVLLYDWLLTLPQEVKYIWSASWNWFEVFYLLTRYIPFVSTALLLQMRFSSNPTPESCKETIRTTCWLSFVALNLVEVILAVRTYAVWRRDSRVGIGLVLLLGLSQIPNAMVLAMFIQAIDYIQDPYPEISRGCTLIGVNRLIFLNWVVFTIVEGVVLVLMIVSAVKSYRKHTSNLSDVIYKDGIRFYLYSFCITFTNILITVRLPIDFVGVGSGTEVVLRSILTCRLMVGIREASQSFGLRPETFELSTAPRAAEATHESVQVLGESARMDLEARAGPSTE